MTVTHFGRRVFILVAVILAFASVARANPILPVLPFPNANELAGQVFVQPFALFSVGTGGLTDPFFSVLPPGSIPMDCVVNILSNFQAFDNLGNSIPTFNILGVEVTVGNSTFTPHFGLFDFAGNSSVTFVDSIDFDQVTFSPANLTLAVWFQADPTLTYSLRLLTDLPEGSFLIFSDVETGKVPEPSSLVLLGTGLIGLWAIRRRHRQKNVKGG